MNSVIPSKHISLWICHLRADGKRFLCTNLIDQTAAEFCRHFPNKSKIQFIPSRFLEESKAALCKRVLKLELYNDDLREENFSLKRKPEKKTASHHHLHLHHQRRRLEYTGMGTPLGLCQAWGDAPVSYHHHFYYLYLSYLDP